MEKAAEEAILVLSIRMVWCRRIQTSILKPVDEVEVRLSPVGSSSLNGTSDRIVLTDSVQ